MSFSIFLVNELTGKSELASEKVRTCLRELPGIRNWVENDINYLLFCEFDYGGDSTIIHMVDSRSIVIEGTGQASLQAAIEIHRCYGGEIYAIGETCCFCIPLSAVSSVADFNDKIDSEFGSEKL